MRVLAIGGGGGMGRHAVSLLQSFDAVIEITVADLNESSANSFAAEMNSKVSALGLDVNDSEAMSRAMQNADIVINTSGPFYRFGVPILQAAINEGCNYLDICDDWEPTIEMLKLDQAAKAAGVTAIVGLGASPGISNMLALIAMQELDEVSSVFTGWDLGGAKPEEESSQEGPNAAMIHGIEQMTGKVQIYRNGAVELVSPLAPVPIHYPGIPTFKGYIFGHPEAVTFPHNYPSLTKSINLAHGGDIDSILLKAILALVNWGIVGKERAAGLLTWFEGQRKEEITRKGSKAPPVMYGLAMGTKGSCDATVGVSWVGEATQPGSRYEVGMGAATGVPLACGVKFMSEGRINESGVFSPEAGLIDPKEFLEEVFEQLENLGKVPSSVLKDNIEISYS
tara:strand:- start:1943 stop:3130 length:1188 start_codon:yes stop_codon:yes gene_type:complete